MNCIPYQKCPVCDGKGFVWNTGVISSVTCDVCNGAKIIPMYIVEDEPEQDYNIDPIIFKNNESN